MVCACPASQTRKLPGMTRHPSLGAGAAAGSLAWLYGIAVARAAVGLLGLRRRDLGDLGPSHGGGLVHDFLVDYLRIGQDPSR